MQTRDAVGEDAQAAPRSVDLGDYWRAVRRRWRVVLVLIVIGAAAGYGYGHFKHSSYTATAQVLVLPLTGSPSNTPANPNLLVNMVTEEAVVQSGPVVAGAAKLIGGTATAASLESNLSKQLSVSNPTGSDVLQITWKSSTSAGAQKGANAFATSYLQYRHATLAGQLAGLETVLGNEVAALQTQITKLSGQLASLPNTAPARQGLVVNLTQASGQLTTANDQLTQLKTYNDSGGTVLAAAPPPQSTSGLSKAVVLILGVLIGLLLGLVVALIRDAVDDRVREASVLKRRTGAPVLAVVPHSPRHMGGRLPALATVDRPDGRAAESIRALRATLSGLGAGGDVRTILVTSADRSSSASRLAAELGMAFAEAGRRSVVVAGNLRSSTLAMHFDASNVRGLANLLGGEKIDDRDLITPIEPKLALITNGPLLSRPLAVLDSPAMEKLLTRLRQEFEVVIIDSPPAVETEDWLALTGFADGVVVVAGEGRTTVHVLNEMRERMEQVGGRLLGTVLISKRADRPPLRRSVPRREGTADTTWSIPTLTAPRRRWARGPLGDHNGSSDDVTQDLTQTRA